MKTRILLVTLAVVLILALFKIIPILLLGGLYTAIFLAVGWFIYFRIVRPYRRAHPRRR